MLQMQGITVLKELNSLDCGPDGHSVAICGNNLLNVYSYNDGAFESITSITSDQGKRTTYQDISWCPVDGDNIAVGTSDRHVIVKKFEKTRLTTVCNIEKKVERCVSSLQFHPKERNLILVSAQVEVILLDLRIPDPAVVTMNDRYRNGVKKVRWNPHADMQYSACIENYIKVVDMRQNSEKNSHGEYFMGHTGPVLCNDWHPGRSGILASAGRDGYLKVWNIKKDGYDHAMKYAAAIDCIKWRPSEDNFILSTSSTFDHDVLCWNIQNPFVPSHSFSGHTRRASQFSFYSKESDNFFSIGKDKTLLHHKFEDASFPEKCTVGHCVKFVRNNDVCHVSISQKKKSKAEKNSKINLHPQKFPGHTTFATCLEKYLLNSDEPVKSCLHNAQIANSCSLYVVAGLWKMLSKIFPKSQKSGSKSRNVSSNVEKQGNVQMKTIADPKQTVSYSASKLPNTHNFGENSSSTSDIDLFNSSMKPSESPRSTNPIISEPKTDILPASSQNLSRKVNDVSVIPENPYNVQHDLFERNAVIGESQNEDSQTELDDDTATQTNVRFAHVMKSLPIILRPEMHQNAMTANSSQPSPDSTLIHQSSLRFFFSLLKYMVEQIGELQFVVTALIVLQNEYKMPDCSGEDAENNGRMLLFFKEWISSYHDALNSMGHYVDACDVSTRFPLNQLREKLGKFERVFCDKPCDDKCKAGCDSCIDPIIDRHSNMQIKVRSSCCASSFLCGRCSKCLKCALCSYCRQPVNSLFAWCQGCGHGGHLNHMKMWFSKNAICLEPFCDHRCEFS